MDQIEASFEEQEDKNILIFTNLDDIGQPYTCSDWGNAGTDTHNLITQDEMMDAGNESFNIFHLYNTSNGYPSQVFIDHEMKIHHMVTSISLGLGGRINEMLANCGDLCDSTTNDDACSEMPGDITLDMNIDMFDIIKLKDYLINNISLSDCEAANANANGNQTINIVDLSAIQDMILE